MFTLLLKNTLLVGSSLVDCTQELQAKCTCPHGSPPSTTMLSRKNSRWCRLATVTTPGSPKSESTMNSAVYTTFSPLMPLFWHQSLIDAWPLCIGFLVPGNDFTWHNELEKLEWSWEEKSNAETWKATASSLGSDQITWREWRDGESMNSNLKFCIVTYLSLNYSAVIRTELLRIRGGYNGLQACSALKTELGSPAKTLLHLFTSCRILEVMVYWKMPEVQKKKVEQPQLFSYSLRFFFSDYTICWKTQSEYTNAENRAHGVMMSPLLKISWSCASS